MESIIQLLLALAVPPEYITLDKVKSEHSLVILFLDSILAFKELRPNYILKVLIIQLELYLLIGSVIIGCSLSLSED